MAPETTTAITPLHLLDLPQELRDDIYEAAIFDLSPPAFLMFHTPQTYKFAYRNMNTNILLTNRKIYWETRDVIIRRGQLVMVSATRLHSGNLREPRLPVEILTGWPRITVIHPKYRNLCIMEHRINTARSSHAPDPHNGGEQWAFIVHQRDIKSFCQALMGKFNCAVDCNLGPKSTHTLILHCPQGYAQNECASVYWAQTRMLQDYRSILRCFEDVSIHGSSTGWESGLYSATLEDIRSIDGMVVGRFIEDVHHLEKEGLDAILQTGDFEAADASWVKALGVCYVARASFNCSRSSLPTFYKGTSIESNTVWWCQLRRESGNACAVLIIECWYRLTRIRLSEVIRLVQRDNHLTDKYGWTLLRFVRVLWIESENLMSSFKLDDGWSPPPYEEVQWCLTVATIYRLLDTAVAGALMAIWRARRLAPDDEVIKQEVARTEAWAEHNIEEEESRRARLSKPRPLGTA